MSFGSSHLAVGDPLGDRFWLSPKKGESVAVGCGRRVSPEPDVCVRRGCGHVSGQQLCNNCSVQSAAQGQGLMQQSSEDFFFLFFPFRFSLKRCDSRGPRIPKFWLAGWLRFCIAAFHGRWNEGAEGCFKFNVLCSLLLGKFRNTMGVLSPPTSAPS